MADAIAAQPESADGLTGLQLPDERDVALRDDQDVSLRDEPEVPLRSERDVALREALAAFFSSRALIWVVGLITVAAVGSFPGDSGLLDPSRLTTPFHVGVLDALVSPAARWDSAWYLAIAKSGYAFPSQTVFFPLFPGLMALGGVVVGSGLELLLGIVISCACAIGGLYLMHRLVALEFDERLARNTVWIFAWLPTALVLSAVYSEALFLLLAVGSFYAARTGRWRLAGLLGGLAAASRNGGILLLVPLLILYLYGPRADRRPDRAADGLRPRYRLRPDVLWAALVPLGLLAYLLYLQIATGHPLDPFMHQSHWGRHFIPFGGIPLGVWSAVKAVIGAVPGLDPQLAHHLSLSSGMRHIVELAFLVIALLLLRFSWRRLPAAYTAFSVVSLAIAVSVPAHNDPLKSLPRLTLVIFPLWIALALWATERNRVRTLLAVSAPLLAVWTFLFVSWEWVP